MSKMSNESCAPERPDEILVLAPTGRDAELTCEILEDHDVRSRLCDSIESVVEGIEKGAGAALITEEALVPDAIEILAETLDKQPKWSEFPIMIFTSQTDVDARVKSLNGFAARTNITLVDRPIRIGTLVSATRSVLRARQHQYEVRDLLQELEQRIHERDQFLAMLGHELRNPLHAIVLASEDGEDADTKLEIIRRQGRRLQRLVDDLLDISRVTRGKIELDRENIDLCNLVERCVIEMTATAEQQNRTLKLQTCDEPVYASIDQVRMEQVLINLIANSLKYTQEGGTIEVTVDAEDDEAVLRVTDNGDGIDPELLPDIFDLFTQAGTRTDVHQGGLGIGLTLVKSMVDLHGGTIRAHSDGAGSGTVMTVRLPREDSVPTGDDPDKQEETANRSETAQTILLVEDNDDIRTLLASRLRRLGHEILEESEGNDGVRTASEKRPDVAIVDIGLPGIDGYEVARRIREEIGSAIYLIAVTGYGQPEDREKALEAGFNEHLTKPVGADTIRKVLSKI